jgi:hypothetical protein
LVELSRADIGVLREIGELVTIGYTLCCDLGDKSSNEGLGLRSNLWRTLEARKYLKSFKALFA